MRRGELAGLRSGDWHQSTHRLSIARSRQVVAGRSVEVAVKTRTSRRCVDLDADTEGVLRAWRRRQQRDGHPVGTKDPIFTNQAGHPVNPESIYQLFHRQVRRLDMPRICFHGLRHTHASLLVAAGTPIKVVSERLGHANSGFTIATYQHVRPGIGAISEPPQGEGRRRGSVHRARRLTTMSTFVAVLDLRRGDWRGVVGWSGELG
jgi:integrase